MKRFGFLFLLAFFVFSAVANTSAAPQAPTIVGGTPAAEGEFPHMVSIGYRKESNGYIGHFCGGSLIKPGWVLTAAHCVIEETASELAVIINRTDLRQSGGEKINVKRVIKHPGYDNDTLDNDMALLELETPSQQGTLIVPVLSSELALEAAGAVSWVTGWGDTTDGGTGSPNLLKVDLPLVSNSACVELVGYDVTTNMICAGTTAGGKDSCQNDSGGPLVRKDSNGAWRQVGVVSWGPGCAQPDTYGVYARVSQYTQWLEDHVGKFEAPTSVTETPVPTTPIPPTATPVPATPVAPVVFTDQVYLPFVAK